MGKIGLIIKREYLTRVRKRSFIVMTILGPLLIASLGVIPVVIADANKSVKVIQVLDETEILQRALKPNDDVKFVYTRKGLEQAKAEMENSDYHALLHVPAFKDNDISHLQRNVRLYANKEVSLGVKMYIRSQVERQIERLQLQSENVDQALVESIKLRTNVPLPVEPLKSSDKRSDVEISTGLGWFGGILIYFFIFLFGAQAMRGVIEEKTNRIVEVIISSVKPFQLMMGKIIGIGCVGLTQFLLWVVLSASIYSVFMNTVVKDKFSASNIETIMKASPDATAVNIDEMNATRELIDRVDRINWGLLVFCFIFYFLGGYLLYGALFAAIGSAVDSESDTQQFMLPITIPLIFSFVMAQAVLQDPSGSLAKWLSIIPFTSPIIMMVRLPFQVAVWELALSMIMLVAGFLLTTWLAAKIYRTGILMYGKKVSWRELGRWLRY